jgi:hypothetical protein
MTTELSKRFLKRLLPCLIGVAILIAIPSWSHAQAQPASGVPDSKPPKYAIDRVELATEPSAECAPSKQGAKAHDPPLAGLGDRISVYFKNCEFPKEAHPTEDWILFLDGVAIKDCKPENSDFKDGKVTFALRRDEKSQEAWKTLLRGWRFYRQVAVTMGTDKGIEASIAKLPDGLKLAVVPQNWRLFVSILLAFCVIVAIAALGAKTNLLKDSTVPADTAPYSLGKVQWAWWLILILYAYLAIGLVTWDYYNIFSASALWLLGISTGTALGSIVIGSSQVSVAETKRDALKEQHANLVSKQEGAADAQKAEVDKQVQQVAGRIDEIEKSLARRSKNFFQDIVSDENGVSLHRFQAVVWTITLGFVFFIGVWNDKAMPDFSPTLLALMGISSGSYLAFKINEEQK